MFKIGAVLVDGNTNGLYERLKTVRNQMKKEAVLINYFISLKQVDRFQVHKIKEMMKQYHIDTLVLHGELFDLLSDNHYFDLIMKLDAFHIPYQFPNLENNVLTSREAFLLYDEHQKDMAVYCNKQGIKCEFQFEMSVFISPLDQEYLLDTMDENELDYLMIEHADQWKSLLDQRSMEKVLKCRFEVLDPIQHVNLSDLVVEACGCMKTPIHIPDKVVLITEKVTKENLQWITKNLDTNLKELDYILIDYMEAGEKGLSKSDRDHLYNMIEQYQIDQIIYQEGIELDFLIGKLKHKYSTFPILDMNFQYEQSIEQQEMIE